MTDDETGVTLTPVDETKIKTFVLAKGMTQAEIDAVIPTGKTGKEVEQAITAWLKTRPKA